MKLVSIENYELKISDEALLIKPIRRLWNQDRSERKEKFYQQMSILYFVYSPSSNYSYIVDEDKRLKEVLLQEGISDFKPSAEFKAAVEIYKKLCVTIHSELLSDLENLVANMRKALNKLTFEGNNEKQIINNIKNAAAITAMLPKIIKDIADVEKLVNKELEESTKARGAQELTVGDIWAEQGL